ncbi:MAG: hypothetical protein Q4D41_11110 [Prevotellaceae bacterium]|nr:hypothetical protein [Prevotellaceae bacterium]
MNKKLTIAQELTAHVLNLLDGVYKRHRRQFEEDLHLSHGIFMRA